MVDQTARTIEGSQTVAPAAESGKAPTSGGNGAACEGGVKDRADGRHAWDHKVQVCWLAADGAPRPPIWMRTAELGAGGICFVSPTMVHAGRRGVVLLVDVSQRTILRWFEVVECRYVGEIHAHHIVARWVAGPSNAQAVRIEQTANGPVLSAGD